MFKRESSLVQDISDYVVDKELERKMLLKSDMHRTNIEAGDVSTSQLKGGSMDPGWRWMGGLPCRC